MQLQIGQLMDEINCMKKKLVFLFVIYLFIYLNSNQLYKQLLEDDKDKFEAELAMKQLLVSLCKSCLQGSQTVETIIRIFGELQEIVISPSTIGDLLADILATLGWFFLIKKNFKLIFCINIDIELFPNDDATTKETYKQRFFQLINNSEVRI